MNNEDNDNNENNEMKYSIIMKEWKWVMMKMKNDKKK